MNQNLLALYGLKWNPFTPELPTEGIYVSPRIENFCWRIEHVQIREGGFAMIHGDPGTGKSVALRSAGRPFGASAGGDGRGDQSSAEFFGGFLSGIGRYLCAPAQTA